MSIRRENILAGLLFAAVFILGGLLHVFLYGVDFANCIVQVYYGTMTFLWTDSVINRITSRRIRLELLGIAWLFVLFFVLQFCSYKFFTNNADIVTFIDYAYYVPPIGITLLMFYVALSLNIPEDRSISPRWHLLCIPAVLLAVLFLTNDLHSLVFVFKTIPRRSDHSIHRIGYYLYIIWAAGLLLSSFIIFIRKSGLSKIGLQTAVPLLPVAAGVLLLMLKVLGHSPKLMGIQLWNMGETYCLMGIGFLEGCIRTGLIPSNNRYDRIFRLLDIPARIVDHNGNEIYATHCAGLMQQLEEHTMQLSTQVDGGTAQWLVDLSRLHKLEDEIELTAQKLESRNELLRTENSVLEEKEKKEAQSRIYTHAAMAVKPQLEAIIRALDSDPADDELARLTVLNAYIKRRCHLELLAAGTPVLDSTELMLAVKESLSYVSLCNVDTWISADENAEHDSDNIIRAYNCFELVLEALLGGLHSLAVFINTSSKGLRMRMLCQADAGYIRQDVLDGIDELLHVENEEGELTLTLTLPKGGHRS